jgi:DNA-binding transcriptional MerR regulator
MTTFGMGRPACSAGIAIDTVRYYERNQLLASAGRLASA